MVMNVCICECVGMLDWERRNYPIQIVMKCISDVLSLNENVGLVGTVKRWPSLQAS